MAPSPLTVDDLRLLGNSYSRINTFAAETTDTSVRFVSVPLSRGSVIFLTAAMIVFSCGLMAVGHFMEVGVLIMVMIALFGLLITGLIYLVLYLNLRHLKSINPLLEFDRPTDRLYLHAQSHSFRRKEVYGLIGLCLGDRGGESNSELQLILNTEEGFGFHLVATYGSYDVRKILGHALQQFGEQTGFRTLLAESPGLGAWRDVRISELTDEQSLDPRVEE